MTREERIKAAVRIAKFCNYPTVATAGRIRPELALAKYRDWNELMGVVKVIESHKFDDYSVVIEKYSVYVAYLDSDGVEHGKASKVFGTYAGTEKEDALFKAIDSFLENNQKYLLK